MPRVSQEKEILQAALECFAELGYDGTRVKLIAERAGVVESALYRHYKSKEEIAQTLFLKSSQLLSSRLEQVAAKIGENGIEATLKAMARLGVEDFKANPAVISFILLQRHNFDIDIPQNTHSPLDIIAEVIAEGQIQGRIRPGEPRLLAAAFVGCFLQPLAFALSPFFKLTSADTIFKNVETLTEMAWAALVNPDS